jgi:hypothetical protein
MNDLKNKAEKLGIPTNSGIYKPKTEAWSELAITEYELHRRIREEERHRREHRLWIVAVISAVIALGSAIATWWPILAGKK